MRWEESSVEIITNNFVPKPDARQASKVQPYVWLRRFQPDRG